MRVLPVMLVLALAVGPPAAAQTVVRVTAQHAVLRYLNADNADVAGEVSAGQNLTATGPLDGAWVPVEPPAGVPFWMYAELVRDGRVAADKAQIRCGAGLSFKVVASVDRDKDVAVCGRLGDWVRIRPLPGLPVWISRSAVALAPTNAPPEPSETPLVLPPAVASGLLAALNATNRAVGVASRDDAASGAVAGAVAPPPELDAFTLTPEPAQGHQVRFRGVLRRAWPDASRTPAAYRLSGPDRSGGIVTYCNVMGPANLFEPHVGRSAIVTGRVWWLVGESVPVITVDQVTEVPAPGTTEQATP